MIHRNRKITLAVVLAIVAIAGISIVGKNSRTPTPSQSVVSLSIAKEYKTLAELRHNADAVALVSVEGVPSTSERFANVPTVEVHLHVERVFGGVAQVGDTITLVQFGDPSGQIMVAEPIPPILQNGKRYVVYLNRQFPDQPQMFITGQAGVFEVGSGAEFHRLGNASADLPKSVSLDQF